MMDNNYNNYNRSKKFNNFSLNPCATMKSIASMAATIYRSMDRCIQRVYCIFTEKYLNLGQALCGIRHGQVRRVYIKLGKRGIITESYR